MKEKKPLPINAMLTYMTATVFFKKQWKLFPNPTNTIQRLKTKVLTNKRLMPIGKVLKAA
jgi:hypothetical protein